MNNYQPQITQEDINNTKSLAWLSYVGILFLVPLLVYKDSAYSKFHVNQGLVLFLCEVILGVLNTIFTFIYIPVLSWVISIVIWLISVVFLVFAILGIVNAATGKVKALPIIGNIKILK